MFTLIRQVLIFFIILTSYSINAATMNISASFSPSLNNPTNNVFTNTTPITGLCATWPSTCVGKNMVSISLPLTAQNTKLITASSSIRDGMFFKIPRAIRQIVIRNKETGETSTVGFYFDFFSTRITPTGGAEGAWENGTLNWSSGKDGCASGLYYNTNSYTDFGWSYGSSSLDGCYKKSRFNRTSLDRYTNMAVSYKLTTPNPLRLGSGHYEGEINYSVGPGGDFDFGDNAVPSDSVLTVKFDLHVNHELKVSATTEDQNITLRACEAASVCTEEQANVLWEKWIMSRIPPVLKGRGGFLLSSSGTFTTWLQCEYKIGTDCAIKSDNSTLQVPVKAMLTLPNNVVDSSSGNVVNQRSLSTLKDLSQLFVTREFGQNKQGSVDFLVDKKSVESMLKEPGTYRGNVTVMFDANIY